MNKEEYKDQLQEVLQEYAEGCDTVLQGAVTELIYKIDNIEVYGGFEEGYRGIDHNILKLSGVTWEDIIAWGTVLVPETRTYISDQTIAEYEAAGYTALPTGSNHITGY